MNERDQELFLDKQSVGLSPVLRGTAQTGVAFIAVFLAGIAIGDILFAHESTRTETSSHLVTQRYPLNGMPPTAGKELGRQTKAASLFPTTGAMSALAQSECPLMTRSGHWLLSSPTPFQRTTAG